MPVTDTIATCLHLPSLLEITGAFAFGGFAVFFVALAGRIMPREKSFYPRSKS